MATVKSIQGSRTSLAYTGSGLSTLANVTYVANTTAYDVTANQPIDVIVELDITTTNTPSGNKQIKAFISESLDGTNYRSGPTSGTTVTREPNLRLLGIMPLTTASTAEVGQFSVLQALGYMPQKFFVIVFNDCGVALTSGTVFTAEISYTVA